MQQRLADPVQLSQTSNERLAHLQQEDGWLDHSSSDDCIHERLQLLFMPYFHGVTVVENDYGEKDDCEGGGPLARLSRRGPIDPEGPCPHGPGMCEISSRVRPVRRRALRVTDGERSVLLPRLPLQRLTLTPKLGELLL